jgi:hypothetical protein
VVIARHGGFNPAVREGGTMAQSANGTVQGQLDSLTRGLLKQIRYQVIDCSAAINAQLFELDCTALVVLGKILSADGNAELTTSPACVVWVRINSADNPWFPLSLDGTSKNLSGYVGTIKKFWVKVRSGETVSPGTLILATLYSLDLLSANGGPNVAGGYAASMTG